MPKCIFCHEIVGKDEGARDTRGFICYSCGDGDDQENELTCSHCGESVTEEHGTYTCEACGYHGQADEDIPETGEKDKDDIV